MEQAALDSTTVAPVLDEALGLAEAALMAQQEAQEKIAAKDRDIIDLRKQLVDQEKVILEKVARAGTLNPVDLDRVFDRFEDLHIMRPGERIKLAAHIQRDPSLILPIFLKAADMLSGAPTEGSGINRDEEDIKEDDCGWGAFCRGEVVKVKTYR